MTKPSSNSTEILMMIDLTLPIGHTALSVCSMNGIRKISAMKTITIFGTKVSVIS